MKISKRQLRRIIKEEMSHLNSNPLVIQMIMEEVALENAPPSEETLDKVKQAIEQGADKVSELVTPEKVLGAVKKVMSAAGFSDPCDFVKKEKKAIQAELNGLEKAAEALRTGPNAMKSLKRFDVVVKATGGTTIAGMVFSGMEYAATTAAQAPDAMMIAGQEGLASGVAAAAKSSWLSWIPGSEAVAAAASNSAAKSAAAQAALDAAAAQSASWMGVSFASWLTIGKIMAALAVVIYVYKFLLKTGIACKMKEFVDQLTPVVAEGMQWGVNNVVKPFVEKFVEWGSGIVKMVKQKVTDFFKKKEKKEVSESLRRGNLRKRDVLLIKEAKSRHSSAEQAMMREWNEMNRLAASLAITVCSANMRSVA